MKPSESVKKEGFKSLKAYSIFVSVPVSTLLDWYKNNRRKFDVHLAGAVAEKTKGDCET